MVKNNIKFIDNNFFDEIKKYMLREAKGFNLMDGISSGSNEPYQQIIIEIAMILRNCEGMLFRIE